MTRKIQLTSIIIFMFLLGCSKSEDSHKQTIANRSNGKNTIHKIQVDEVLQAANYTYIKAKEQEKQYWIAVSKRDAQPGEILYYTGGLLMKKFKSKPLNRTFDEIYFLQKLSDDPTDLMPTPVKSPIAAKNPAAAQPVEPIAGEVSLADLFAHSKKYDHKRIKVRGKVSKAMSGILGRTFFHLVDTGDSAKYDLTVTTKSAVHVNDMVTAEGVITLNKDFGSGYFYKIILEDAKIGM